MRNPRSRCVSIIVPLLTCWGSFAAPAYPPPAEGWDYRYEGSAADAGSGTAADALDGAWSHDNSSDTWDGSVIGSGRPGGASALTEGDTAFLRIQDTGDPRDYGLSDPGSNRKICFLRDFSGMGLGDSLLDDGVTLSFRARLATAPPLDDRHPDGGGGIDPWPTAGDGCLIHDGGKGHFSLHQATGGLISFSLATAADLAGTGLEAGLIMNALNGAIIGGNVDTLGGGTPNHVPLDPTLWHEFWITIQAGGTGTHRVSIYADGSLTATEFEATAGSATDHPGGWLGMGFASTAESGALDLDFIAVAAGIHAPVPWPPPTIISEPADVTILEGGQAQFTVGAEGGESLGYQWFKGGSAIPDATGSVFEFEAVSRTDAGAYSVVITNEFGSVTSRDATLTVEYPPAITDVSGARKVFAGETVVLTATVAGVPEPELQWSLGEAPVEGAVSNRLELAGITLAQGGDYTLVATNPHGTVTSGVVTVTVVDPETYAAHPGALDLSFSSGVPAFGLMLQQPDRKLIVGGRMRLHPDGQQDESFVVGPGISDLSANAAMLQPDGKLILAGYGTVDFLVAGNWRSQEGIVRLNHDGTPDLSFCPGRGITTGIQAPVHALALEGDGKILLGGHHRMAFNNREFPGILRLLPNGSLDTSFDPGAGIPVGAVSGLAVASDGKIMLAGQFSFFDGVPRPGLARLNHDGSLDPTFDPVMSIRTGGNVSGVAIQPDGRYLVGGAFDVLGHGEGLIVRLNPDGSLDESFSEASELSEGGLCRGVILQPDGRIICAGRALMVSENGPPAGLLRLNPDGSLDETFTPVQASPEVRAALLQRDGRILLELTFGYVDGFFRRGLVRVMGDPPLESAPVITLQPRSLQTVAAGEEAGFSVEVTGFPQPEYQWHHGDNPLEGETNAMLLIPSVGGEHAGAYSVTVANSSGSVTSSPATLVVEEVRVGSVDAAFAPVLNGAVRAVAVQADGQIVVGGQFGRVNEVPRAGVARLRADGTLDGSLMAFPNSPVYAVAVQPNQRILIGGRFATINGVPQGSVGRLDHDGSVDPTFLLQPGLPIQGRLVDRLRLQSDGRILVAGDFPGLLRLKEDGSLDEEFHAGFTPARRINDAVVQDDGRILVSGSFTAVNGVPRPGFARLNPDGSTDLEFEPGPPPETPPTRITLGLQGELVVAARYPSATPLLFGFVLDDGTLGGVFTVPEWNSFNAGIAVLAIDSRGGLLAGGSCPALPFGRGGNIARLHPDYSWDTSFVPGGTDGAVYDVAVLADGDVLLAGAFGKLQGGLVEQPYLARIRQAKTTTPRIKSRSWHETAVWRDSATLSVSAEGAPPLSYQWFFGDDELPGETNAVLTLARVQPEDAGYYHVTVSNAFGSVTTPQMELEVRPGLPGNVDPNVVPEVVGNIHSLAAQDDGRIVIGGDFQTVDGVARSGLARLNPDGTLDRRFGLEGEPPRPTPLPGGVRAVAMQGDQGILAGGSFGVVRVTPDGRVDPGFHRAAGLSGLTQIAVQKDERILVAHGTLTRLKPDGQVDESFNPTLDGFVRTMAIQADGRILAANDSGPYKVMRLNPDGSLDWRFQISLPLFDGSGVYRVALDSQERILLGGDFHCHLGAGAFHGYRIARLLADGRVDTGFQAGSTPLSTCCMVWSVADDTRGGILVGGDLSWIGGAPLKHFARLHDDGSVDTSFAVNGQVDGLVRDIQPMRDGSAWIIGGFHNVQGVPANGIARVFVSPDATFEPRIVKEPLNTVVAEGELARLEVDVRGAFPLSYQWYSEDGTPVACATNASLLISNVLPGQAGSYWVNVTNPWGSVASQAASLTVEPRTHWRLDRDFQPELWAPDGTVSAVLRASDGTLLVGGSFTQLNGIRRLRVGRLLADGSVDPDFDTSAGPDAPVSCLALQEDGKVIIGGRFSRVEETSINSLARLNTDGSIDPTFEPRGPLPAGIASVAVAFDGMIIAGGDTTVATGAPAPAIVRLLPNGVVNRQYPSTASACHRLTTLPDGEVLASGMFSYGPAIWREEIRRFDADGAVIHTYPLSGPAFAFELLEDGGLVAADGGRVVRFLPTGQPDPGFHSALTDGWIGGLSVLPDGAIVITGGFWSVDGISCYGVARLNPDGTLDEGLVPPPEWEFVYRDWKAVTVDAESGEITVAGDFFGTGTDTAAGIQKLANDGTLLPDSSVECRRSGVVWAMGEGKDGGALLGGDFGTFAGRAGPPVGHITAGGLPDEAFPQASGLGGVVYSLARLGSGPFLVGGDLSISQGGPWRPEGLVLLTQDGSDFLPNWYKGPPFDAQPIVYSLSVYDTDRAMVAGLHEGAVQALLEPVVLRNSSDLFAEPLFPSVGIPKGVVRTAKWVGDELLVGGDIEPTTFSGHRALAKFRSNGAWDTVWDSRIGRQLPAGSVVHSMTLDAGRYTVAGGEFTALAGRQFANIVRLLDNDTIDLQFKVWPGANGPVTALLYDPEGNLLVGGDFTELGGASRCRLGQLDPMGQLDPDFAPAFDGPVHALYLTEAGDLLVGGAFTTVDDVPCTGLVRFAKVPLLRVLRAELSARGFEVTIQTSPGLFYRLEHRDSLSDADWIRLEPEEGDGGLLTLIDESPNASARFYRVSEACSTGGR